MNVFLSQVIQCCVKIGSGLTITLDGTLSAETGGSGTVSEWGDLTGTLSAQTDLWNVLNNKVSNTQYATNSIAGIIKIGAGINISDNTISVSTSSIGAATSNHTHSNYSLTSHTHSQYLTNVSLSDWNAAAGSSGQKTIGNSNNNSYVDIVEDLKITQNAAFSKVPTVGGTAVALTSDLHNHSNKSYLDNINQYLSTSSAVQHGSLKCTGDVVAYSTGSASAPFKYWKPSVSTAGLLSWTNSTSESVPASVNIKGTNGTNGTNGQGVTYQWSGTSLRLGTISSAGSTAWGSYVNLKGDKGDSGGGSGSWNGGTVANTIITPNLWINTTYSGHRLAVNGSMNIVGSALFNDSTTYIKGNTSTRIWGNAVDAWSNTNAGRPRLWLNYYRPSGWNYQSEVFIGNGDGTGTQVVTINTYGNGKLLVKNGTGTLSDSRLKVIFNKQTKILDKIKNINVYDYTRIDDEDKILRTGVIAQEVAEHFPTLASRNFLDETNNEKYYSVDYATLATVVSIVGVKELNQKIENQQTEINELKNKIDDLQNKMNQLIKTLEKQ